MLHVVAIAVCVVFAGHVPHEGVAAVGPPEAGAVVLIERQRLPGQRLGAIGLHGEIAVEQIVDLGAVFHEEPVPGAAVTDAIADDEIFGAVDRHPAIARIDDRDAQHLAAAHGVADEMEMDRVAAEHAFLAEMCEAGVADAAAAVGMIHRVTTHAGGIGAFHDDIAGEIGDFAAEFAAAGMFFREGLVEFKGSAVDPRDAPLLGAQLGLIVFGIRSAPLMHFGRRHDHFVPRPPAIRRSRQASASGSPLPRRRPVSPRCGSSVHRAGPSAPSSRPAPVHPSDRGLRHNAGECEP